MAAEKISSPAAKAACPAAHSARQASPNAMTLTVGRMNRPLKRALGAANRNQATAQAAGAPTASGMPAAWLPQTASAASASSSSTKTSASTVHPIAFTSRLPDHPPCSMARQRAAGEPAKRRVLGRGPQR
jgi:hypothetical protein